jgi:hypothetical protein
LQVVQSYKALVFSKKEYVLSKQLLRSGTSIGANVRSTLWPIQQRFYFEIINCPQGSKRNEVLGSVAEKVRYDERNRGGSLDRKM